MDTTVVSTLNITCVTVCLNCTENGHYCELCSVPSKVIRIMGQILYNTVDPERLLLGYASIHRVLQNLQSSKQSEVGLKVCKLVEPMFGCITNLDLSSVLYLHSCLDMRNEVRRNKPTMHFSNQYGTLLPIKHPLPLMFCIRGLDTYVSNGTQQGIYKNYIPVTNQWNSTCCGLIVHIL